MTKHIKDIYQHYKGGYYEVVCIAIHTETNEEVVVYKNNKGDFFVRPYMMFFEKIEINGILIDRFKKCF